MLGHSKACLQTITRFTMIRSGRRGMAIPLRLYTAFQVLLTAPRNTFPALHWRVLHGVH